jgi:hypothetical protein
MHDASRTAYLFQCEDEDLYAVSMTVQGATSPDRLARKAGACEVFQLGRHSPVPAPIMAETILKGILDAGYYMRRGWSSGSSERPAKFAL